MLDCQSRGPVLWSHCLCLWGRGGRCWTVNPEDRFCGRTVFVSGGGGVGAGLSIQRTGFVVALSLSLGRGGVGAGLSIQRTGFVVALSLSLRGGGVGAGLSIQRTGFVVALSLSLGEGG